jgi:hypothetical protein
VNDERPLRDSNAAVTWHPGKLWSLWDIMKPFSAALFVRLTEAAGMLRSMERIEGLFQKFGVPPKDANAEEKYAACWLEQIDLYEKHCVEMELTASVATIKKIRKVLAGPNPPSTEINALIIELSGRLYDEMNGRVFWALTMSEAAYYSNPRKGWEKIIERFRDTVIDIEEASKCFALSRYAAAVFIASKSLR